MRVIRRVALYVALPLAVALAAGHSWYRLSDTGKGWRYEDKLAAYCDGLIPHDESAAFTGLDTESGLSRDQKRGSGDLGHHSCEVAGLSVTIGLIPEDAVNIDEPGDGILDELGRGPVETLPMPLGGGWRGFTDMRTTAVVLACDNKPASVVVSVEGDASHDTPDESRAIAELAAATARKAAGHWSCEAEQGGRIPAVPQPAGETSEYHASGTCAGVPARTNDAIDWIKETKAAGTAPLESCVLGETVARSEALYHLGAAFGPYAQRLRSEPSEPGALNGESGIRRDHAWATAACSGHAARAVFQIRATEYAHPRKNFLLASLRAFAERSVRQHGCSDLKLPR